MGKKILLFVIWLILASQPNYAQLRDKPDKECPPGFTKVLIDKNWKCEYLQNLPVTLIRFDATRKGDKAILTWATATEVNHSHYEVEYASDGRNFVYLGRTGLQWVEHKPENGHNYYRLISVDLDGTRHYYKIVYLFFEIEWYEVYSLDGRYLGKFTWNNLPPNQTLIIHRQRYIRYK